ncbi:MAG: hypothetical protein ACC645_26950 [Pirellulales bacterium]
MVMFFRFLPLAVLALAAFGTSDPVAAGIVLVESGQPQATIVVAEDASDQAKEAARVLQEYLQKISGARLEIENELAAVAGSRILVGRSKAVADLGVRVPSGSTYQMDEEGFVSKTVGGELILAGNEDWQYRGTLYAVYDLLEEIGCRWFFFVNKIAKEVYKEFPHRWLFTNGYANRVRPPEGVGPLSPNLGIQSAVLPACSLHRIGDPKCWQRILYRQLIDRWTDALDCVFIYDLPLIRADSYHSWFLPFTIQVRCSACLTSSPARTVRG